MTSSNGNIFCVTGLLCGEFTGPQWIPRSEASDADLWCFLWSAPWISSWVNNRDAGGLRRHRGHYDVIVMPWHAVIWSRQRNICNATLIREENESRGALNLRGETKGFSINVFRTKDQQCGEESYETLLPLQSQTHLQWGVIHKLLQRIDRDSFLNQQSKWDSHERFTEVDHLSSGISCRQWCHSDIGVLKIAYQVTNKKDIPDSKAHPSSFTTLWRHDDVIKWKPVNSPVSIYWRHNGFIMLCRASNTELWCFLWSTPE